MSEVELPVVDGDTDIRQAIEILRQNGRSGLVTARDARLIVLTCVDLTRHLRQIKRDTPMKLDAPISQVEPQQATMFTPQLDRPLPTDRFPHSLAIVTVKSLMRTMGMDFAIAPKMAATVRVVTVHEPLALALALRVQLCKCPTCHDEWASEELQGGTKCPNDGSTVPCS